MPKQPIENQSPAAAAQTSKVTSIKNLTSETAVKPKKTSRAKQTTSKRKTDSTDNTATQPIPNETRLQLIEETAYYIAEQRGFNGGDPVQDWIQAESHVAKLLSQG